MVRSCSARVTYHIHLIVCKLLDVSLHFNEELMHRKHDYFPREWYIWKRDQVLCGSCNAVMRVSASVSVTAHFQVILMRRPCSETSRLSGLLGWESLNPLSCINAPPPPLGAPGQRSKTEDEWGANVREETDVNVKKWTVWMREQKVKELRL